MRTQTLLFSLTCIAPAFGFQADQQNALFASDAGFVDGFGSSLALDGSTAVAGTPEYGYLFNTGPGKAYVFTRSSATWTQQAKLTASDGAPGDTFGDAVALDGDTAVVAASGQAQDRGAVYVYERNGAGWHETVKLVASDGAAGHAFGSSVALLGDTIAVGAALAGGAQSESGAVYVFGRDPVQGWTELTKISPSPGSAGERFGHALSLDADHLLVGAPGFAPNSVVDAGSVYAFERVGADYVFTQRLTATAAEVGDAFGYSLNHHGTALVIGAPHEDQEADDAGAIYVFESDGALWIETAKLTSSEAVPGGLFGAGVALDGDLLVAGAPWETTTAVLSGAAYVFAFDGSVWDERDRFVASAIGEEDLFGYAVALQGSTAVISAPQANGNVPITGGAFPFSLVDTVGTPYCFGDGSGSACPCGNASAAGLRQGCRNTYSRGVALRAVGSPSVAADDLRLVAQNVIPGFASTLLFVGDATVYSGDSGAGTPFGSGLRCVGGSVMRLLLAPGDFVGDVSYGPGLAASGPFFAGEIRRFQVWYRDVYDTCGGGFNLSNALEVTFAP